MYSIIGHIDTLMNFDRSSTYNFSKDNRNFQVDLVKMKKSKVKVAVFAIFVEPEYKPHFALERTIQLIDRFHKLVDSYKELELIEDLSDLKRVMANEKIGVLLAIEGAEGIFADTALRIFYRLGVRMISLTWNQRNQFADGVGEIEANGGLTCLGKEIVKEMERLKIILDVSHLAPAGFWDIANLAKIPFIASHSNALGVCNHKRNLTDKQIKVLANRNGLIGINFAPEFLNDNKKVEISDVIEHIDYIRELVGIEKIVLGTDYDGIENTPIGLEDIGKINNLKRELAKHNFQKEEIEKVFYKNWLQFFNKIWS